MGLAVFGVVTAAIAGVLMWKRKDWRRTQAVLLLVTGLAVSGLFGGVRDGLAGWAASASASATARLFGVGVPYAIAVILVGWFVLDMDLDGLVNRFRPNRRGGGENRHKTTAVTPWLALIVPVALATLPMVGGLTDVLRDGATQFASMLG